MARSVISDQFEPEIFAETMASRLALKNVLKGGMLVATGAVVVDPSLSMGKNQLGQSITLPYNGGVGLFQENIADGTAATPRAPGQTTETATVTRDTLAFEMTRWAQAGGSGDPYADAVDSVMQALGKISDLRCVDAAVATGVLTKTIAADAGTLTYDTVVDALARFGDEQEDIVAMMVHSETKRDLLKLKDDHGNPFLVPRQNDGDFDRFVGIPVGVSNQVPLTGSTMGGITATGNSPPTVTIAGVPEGAWDLKIDIVVGGGRGTATFRFSTDDGDTWSDTHVTAATFVLDESPQAATAANAAADSLVGINGSTGITATFGNATYDADNVYRAQADLRVSTLILKRSSIGWWFNEGLLGLQTDKDILVDSDVAAMHLYGAAKRFRRRAGGTQTGVLSIVHDVSGYDGTL